MKKFIQWKLGLLARTYLRLKKIEIVAITGSAGKTTTKSTLGQIVSESKLYVPSVSYNTEYGVPLALFKETVPENPRNIFAWFFVIFRMSIKFFLPTPYKRIVLEYGADKPGDISYLTSFAHPHIAVVTVVLPVHMEGFTNIESITKEKAKLVESLKKQDYAVLNADDKNVSKMSKLTAANVITYGLKGDVSYSSLKYNELGMVFDIGWKDNTYPVNIPVVAPQLISSYLSAFTVGLLLGEDPKTLAKKLSYIEAEKGRMNLLKGIHDSTIIDDSYNSNPESAKAALDVLSKYPGHKIALLGSMNELGEYVVEGHTQVAEKAVETADEILTVGDIANKYLYPTALAKMDKENVKKYTNSDEAGKYLSRVLKKGDVVLVKGSQNGVFTEEAIKHILKESDKSSDLLVRQGPMWQNKKGITNE